MMNQVHFKYAANIVKAHLKRASIAAHSSNCTKEDNNAEELYRCADAVQKSFEEFFHNEPGFDVERFRKSCVRVDMESALQPVSATPEHFYGIQPGTYGGAPLGQFCYGCRARV